jgi:uncharacterized protein
MRIKNAQIRMISTTNSRAELLQYSAFLKQQSEMSHFAQRSFAQLVSNISKADFPCYFAKNVLTRDTLYVSFIENFSDKTDLFAQISAVFSAYAEIERQPDPYRVLVLSVDIQLLDWEADDALLWEFLEYLHRQDPEPWPADVPQDPAISGWSFCFKGMPWFFNVNSPNNQDRQSRNITDSFAFVIQRTDGFDDLAPLDKHDKLRWDLRARCLAYDGQASSPALALGADNPEMLEWIQFHTPNLNTEKPKGKCPYHHS